MRSYASILLFFLAIMNGSSYVVPAVAHFEVGITDISYPGSVNVAELLYVGITIRYSDAYHNTVQCEVTDATQWQWRSGSVVLTGTGTYYFSASLHVRKVGDWRLTAKIKDASGTLLASQAFTVKVVGPKIQITKIDKPPGTIAVKEQAIVRATIKYENLAPSTKLTLHIAEEGASMSIGASNSIPLTGTGTYTFPDVRITPTKAGTWRLNAKIKDTSSPYDEYASKAFTITVAGLKVTITRIDKPPGTIAANEQALVKVTIKYENLAPSTILKAGINDEDAHVLIGTVVSAPLSGTGTYTFPDILITTTKTGTWHLKAKVQDSSTSTEYASKTFTIQVATPNVKITKIDKPPGTIAAGEQALVKVTIKYENLAPSTILKVYINDEDADRQIGVASSIALSGTGTYTFPDILITLTRTGTRHLSAEIKDLPQTVKTFTITVV